MERFRLGMKPFDVCKVILRNNPIERITLAQHKVGLNWTQKYATAERRKRHVLGAYAVRPMKRHAFSKAEFLAGGYSKLLSGLKQDEVISVASKVTVHGSKEMHMPLMNFHTADTFGLEEIKKVVAYVCGKRRGALLKSGRFYHYYGDFLLNQTEWERFMGMFLIPVHLVHPAYIGHALKYGFNTLRLTSGEKYKTRTPRVVYVRN